ncbi:TPA: DUF2726 domain-containing protein [Enterobacter cloacae]|nr:DUF2726 domain-containing protein [Enterobacter cloacae]
MSDDMINIIGIGLLAALFWYIQIYRPKKKLRSPGELQLKSAMTSDEREMYAAVNTLFSAPYIIKNNVTLDDLVFSPSLNKKPFFHKAMREQKIAWLILNDNYTPVLAVDIITGDDEIKLNCLASAGIPCCIMESGTPAPKIAAELTKAAAELSLPLTGALPEPEPQTSQAA